MRQLWNTFTAYTGIITYLWVSESSNQKWSCNELWLKLVHIWFITTECAFYRIWNGIFCLTDITGENAWIVILSSIWKFWNFVNSQFPEMFAQHLHMKQAQYCIRVKPLVSPHKYHSNYGHCLFGLPCLMKSIIFVCPLKSVLEYMHSDTVGSMFISIDNYPRNYSRCVWLCACARVHVQLQMNVCGDGSKLCAIQTDWFINKIAISR